MLVGGRSVLAGCHVLKSTSHVHFVSSHKGHLRTSGCLPFATRCRDSTAFVEEEREEKVAGSMLLVVADNISVYDNG